MLRKCALGVEISEDRTHTAIAAAGTHDDATLVELVHYLEGVDGALRSVQAIRKDRTVTAIVIDPHSPGATLLRPLADAGIKVLQPSTSDVVVAFGSFLDELAAGRLRHVSDARLDAAVRAGTQRPIGGAAAWNRRDTTVDVAPLTAATFATWAWLTAPSGPAPMAMWA